MGRSLILQLLIPPFQVSLACLVIYQTIKGVNLAVYTEEGEYVSSANATCDRADFSCSLIDSLQSDNLRLVSVDEASLFALVLPILTLLLALAQWTV